MITSKFVSCYSCAGEGSDRFVDQLGKRGRAGLELTILCCPSRASARIGSASFIFFDHFSELYCNHI